MNPWLVFGGAGLLLAIASRARPSSRPGARFRVAPLRGVALPTRGLLSYLYQRSDTHKHRGIDLASPVGTPVRAVSQGIVEHASNRWADGFSGYGRHVVIRHGKRGPWSLYAHLDRVRVRPGDAVPTGHVIGTVGTTRFSRADHRDHLRGGAHLHFELAPRPYPMGAEATRLDPVAWIAGG
jgi:murein DD-endopeptidase MepM/ murein hydrolase activator NlpD